MRRIGLRNRWTTSVGLGLVLVVLLAAGGRADSALDAKITEFQLVPMGGAKPPAFSLDTLDGKKVGPGDLKGRAVLLYFWATW
jgi:cytochrome oxidase Cu insertion factor (SCO1/SenC/PrrC family)